MLGLTRKCMTGGLRQVSKAKVKSPEGSAWGVASLWNTRVVLGPAVGLRSRGERSIPHTHTLRRVHFLTSHRSTLQTHPPSPPSLPLPLSFSYHWSQLHNGGHGAERERETGREGGRDGGREGGRKQQGERMRAGGE